jgi:pterin-4a-carbinolamine dehydratase
MTAKDELAFKTPDALMNGQAIVDVIQSCIPSIKDAWKTPNIDMDMILVAIRIATYGETMEFTHVVPNTAEQVEHTIDLRIVLDQLSVSRWEDAVEINEELTCFVRPLTYKHITLTGMKAFETQRLMQAVNDENMEEEKKLEIFNKSFSKMTDITIDLVADSVQAIQTPETLVKEPQYIKEFLKNADSDLYKKINDHITRMKEVNGIQPMKFTSTPEQIELGAPETYDVPVSFDNSDFFAQGS